MNRYERYKDSGIPWLGEVPAHWDEGKLKNICTAFGRIGFRGYSTADLVSEGEGPITLSPSNIKNTNMDYEKCTYLSWEKYLESPEIMLYKNDIVIVKTGSSYGKVGFIDDLPTEATINPQLLVIKRININSKYLFYILLSEIFQFQINQNVIGSTIPTISESKILNFNTPYPIDMNEQITIAHYLDTKLGEIDALIGKQQTLLEKLAEQRTAVITRAVTKGLNPAAPMKNSGVKWLGDVPAHWQLINLKFLCRVKGGYAFSSDNFSDDGIPVIRISDILFDGTVDNINCKRIPLELAPNQKDFELRNGQLVMAMTGATIGKISKYSSEDYAYINQRVGKFEAFNSRLNYAFLYHLLNTSGYQEHIKLTAFGGAQPNISDSEMVNYQMALPTMEEQANIADYLYQEAAKIDCLCDTVNQTIGRLKEYRTALITQAVTGKIKVTDE